ncbi:unnamed protein product [Prunus brigantina]
MDQRNVYAIPELDPSDNDVDLVDQRFESSMENVAQTLVDSDVIQEPFQLEGVSSREIPIQSITIDLGDLPRYDPPVGPNNDDDVLMEDEEDAEEEEEEEDWETESDDSDVLQMSDLIRSRKAVTTASSLPPPETTSAATAPAQVHAMAVCPQVPHAPASSESFVAQPVSARRRHRPPA